MTFTDGHRRRSPGPGWRPAPWTRPSRRTRGPRTPRPCGRPVTCRSLPARSGPGTPATTPSAPASWRRCSTTGSRCCAASRPSRAWCSRSRRRSATCGRPTTAGCSTSAPSRPRQPGVHQPGDPPAHRQPVPRPGAHRAAAALPARRRRGRGHPAGRRVRGRRGAARGGPRVIRGPHPDPVAVPLRRRARGPAGERAADRPGPAGPHPRGPLQRPVHAAAARPVAARWRRRTPPTWRGRGCCAARSSPWRPGSLPATASSSTTPGSCTPGRRSAPPPPAARAAATCRAATPTWTAWPAPSRCCAGAGPRRSPG